MMERAILNRRVFRNQNLFFSEYYLDLLLSERKITRETEKAFRRFRRIYEWADSRLHVGSSSSELLKSLIQPSFTQILGFPEIRPLSHSSTYGLFGAGNDQALALLNILRFTEDLDIGQRKSFRFSKTFRFQETLDRNAIRWGILTNGELLRLLSQSAPSGSWFEIDLRTLFSEGNENDFWLFLRLISLDAFVPDEEGKNFLDHVVENGKKEAERVQENLGEVFQIALEKFANSMLSEHPDLLQRYSVEKVHHDLTILFFRLLVIFYAESREILPLENEFYRKGYSLEGLRDFVEIHQRNFTLRSSYLWQRLKALFKLLWEGIKAAPLFVLEPFGSALFNPTTAPVLEEINPGDNIIGELILAFSLTPPRPGSGRLRISYRELDVEQIGSIYEQILDLQPKIAQKDLVVAKLQAGKEVILTTEQAQKERLRIEKEIPKGTFYLSTWGGTRKLTGTYYTPKLVTRFLVENALKPFVEERTSQEILKLKILDPAMGSGAFLVAACRFLADAYLQKRKEEGLIDEAPQIDLEADARRKIAENCLYGVDKNPRAVELAQLSLWLVTASRDMPLAFLKHKLVCGDSLIGSKINELDKDLPVPLFPQRYRTSVRTSVHTLWKSFFLDRETFREAIKLRNRISALPDRDIVSLEKKEWFYKKLQQIAEFKKAKEIGDLRTALWFLSDEWKEKVSGELYAEIAQAIWEENKDRLSEEAGALLDEVRKVSERERFFHWEIVFPEAFFDEDGNSLPPDRRGFDLVIGNPPWEAIKPLTDEFFSEYEPLVFNKKGAKREKEEIKQELLNSLEIRKTWDAYRENREVYSFYLRNSNEFPLSSVGELNTYRIFLERMLQLTKSRGKVAVFIHGGIYSDDRTKVLRKALFDNHKIEFLYGFENRKKLLKAVDSRFKYILLSIEKSAKPSSFPAKSMVHEQRSKYLPVGSTSAFPAIFMLHEPEVLFKSDFKPVSLNPELIKRFSPESLSIPEINNQKDLELLEAVYKDRPLMREMGFRLYNELHMTNDSDLFIPVSGCEEVKQKGFIPLYEGKMIEQFRVDWEEPRYGVEREEVGDRLGEKAEFLEKYRVGVRSVARSTDHRTIISAIVFPTPVCGNSINLIEPLSSEISFWLSALLNSLPFDAVLRLKVSANVNIHFLYDAPYLPFDPKNSLHKEIIKLSATLTAGSPKFGEKYRELLAPLRLDPKPLTEEERKDLQSKLEALMLRAWQIPEGLIPYLFSRFPLLSEDYKDKIRQYFEKTKRGEL